MRGDVALRAAAIVAARGVEQPRCDPGEPLGAPDIAQGGAVAHEQIEDRHRIGARPVARRPALIPADRSGECEPPQRAPAVDRDGRHRRPAAPTEQPPRPVRQHGVDRADREPGVDPIEDAMIQRRDDARDAAALARHSAHSQALVHARAFAPAEASAEGRKRAPWFLPPPAPSSPLLGEGRGWGWAAIGVTDALPRRPTDPRPLVC